MAKIVISINGGALEAVHSDDPDVEVIVYDWDNIKATWDGDPEDYIDDEDYQSYVAGEQQDYDLEIQNMEQVA